MQSKGNKSFASKTGTMTLREPETIRLGRDTDKLVELMEHEKRESDYLDQQIALLQEELFQIKTSKKKNLPSIGKEDHQKNKCIVLEKKIDLEVIHLNETKAQSQVLRNEIDSYRKDKSHYKRTLQNIRADINKFSQVTDSKKQEYSHGIEMENRYRKKIQNLRSKSMLDRSLYTEKVSDYSLFIKEKIDVRKQIHKQIEQSILGQIKQHTDSVEISKLQRTLVGRWEAKLKEKKKELDNYMKHLIILQEAFSQIKLATGIHSVSEIVTAVIKSEDQNYEVYSYVNSLNTEIDDLNETYRILQEKIQLLESKPKVNNNEEADLINKVTGKKEEKKNEYEKLSGKVQKLLPVLKNILSRCIESPIPLKKIGLDLTEIDTLEYEQIAELLGCIEDYTGYANVFLSMFESKPVDKRLEKTGINIKDLEIRNSSAEYEFEDSRTPLTILEFQQRSKTLLKDTKYN